MGNSFKKQFENITSKIEDEVSGHVSFEELFDLGFMDKNTDFSTFQLFLEHFEFDVNSQEDFENLDEGELDNAIQKSSSFTSWKEMYEAAGKEYVYKKLTDAGFELE